MKRILTLGLALLMLILAGVYCCRAWATFCCPPWPR